MPGTATASTATRQPNAAPSAAPIADAQPRADGGDDPLEGVGPTADLGGVVVGDQRLHRRVVDGVAGAERRPQDEQLPEALCRSGQRGGHRPEPRGRSDEHATVAAVGEKPPGYREAGPRTDQRGLQEPGLGSLMPRSRCRSGSTTGQHALVDGVDQPDQAERDERLAAVPAPPAPLRSLGLLLGAGSLIASAAGTARAAFSASICTKVAVAVAVGSPSCVIAPSRRTFLPSTSVTRVVTASSVPRTGGREEAHVELHGHAAHAAGQRGLARRHGRGPGRGRRRAPTRVRPRAACPGERAVHPVLRRGELTGGATAFLPYR